jgi:hypothetical protein
LHLPTAFSAVFHVILPAITVCIALHQQRPNIKDFLTGSAKFLLDDILPALFQSMNPTSTQNNALVFDRFSCMNIIDTASVLPWCTQIRRRYSHPLLQGLCSLIHDCHPVGASAIPIIRGLRNRLERVSSEVDSLFAKSDEKQCRALPCFGQPDPTKLKVSLNVPSWVLTNSFFGFCFLIGQALSKPFYAMSSPPQKQQIRQ